MNYQIAVNVYIFTPSNPNLAASYYWYLNEQDCGRDDRYESISITNASKGGDLLITFFATDDHGDENPSSYEVSLVTHDISNRDLIHDEDQDGVQMSKNLNAARTIGMIKMCHKIQMET